MNVETMRARFIGNAAGLADDLEPGAIDAYLTRAYQFDVPAQIDGEISETTWTLTTADGTEDYAYPAYIVAPGEHAWINDAGGSLPLWVTTNPTLFEHRYALPAGSEESRPTAILFYGRSAKLAPVPDAAYEIEIPARGGPANALTDGGDVPNDTHAMCVVHAALVEFLTEIGADELVANNMAAMDRYSSRLATVSLARPRSRVPRRSF